MTGSSLKVFLVHVEAGRTIPKDFFFPPHKISDSDGRLNHLSYYEAAILFLDTKSHFN